MADHLNAGRSIRLRLQIFKNVQEVCQNPFMHVGFSLMFPATQQLGWLKIFPNMPHSSSKKENKRGDSSLALISVSGNCEK